MTFGGLHFGRTHNVEFQWAGILTDTEASNLTKFVIRDTADPKAVGLWVQSILLANPNQEFILKRDVESEEFICEPIPIVDGEGRDI
tara:strand:+ start:574 stop:834 length:261 start_codon:yes stop_codon:yes gene_type:complete